MGNGLRTTLDTLLTQNTITRAIAAQRVNELASQLQSVLATLNQICNGLKALGVEGGRAIYGDGACEVAVLIPDPEHKETLENFDSELDGFNSLLKYLNELSGDGGVSPRVTGLDSGSWLLC